MNSFGPVVVSLGEVLWDRFPDGDRLGGAPANFAFHAAQFGARAKLVSRVGLDSDGDRLLLALGEHGVDKKFLQKDARLRYRAAGGLGLSQLDGRSRRAGEGRGRGRVRHPGATE
jgi:sugar/nucleoside kinase (ribokinase family)